MVEADRVVCCAEGLTKRSAAPREHNEKGIHLHFIFYRGNIILAIILFYLLFLMAFAPLHDSLLPFLLVIL